MVFVLSPNSLASTVCLNELTYALQLNKRIFPAVIADINWASAPDGLARIHSLFFKEIDRRDAALDQLVEALETDIKWICEHTRLGALSSHWSAHGRPVGDLLRGRALEEAEQWLTRQPKTARSPTSLHQEFIRAGRDAARRRGRVLVAVSLAIALAASVLGIVAYGQKLEAESNERKMLLENSRMLSEFAEAEPSQRRCRYGHAAGAGGLAGPRREFGSAGIPAR